MEASELVKAFLCGEIDIHSFLKKYESDSQLNDFFEDILKKVRKSGKNFRPYPFPHPFLKEEIISSDEGVSYLLRPNSYPPLRFGAPQRYDSVRRMLTYEYGLFTHDPDTASGALRFFREVLVLFYQTDPEIRPTDRYEKDLFFLRETVPSYLYGGEPLRYIEKKLLPLCPATLSASARKKALKNLIREAFKSEKGFPLWVQEPMWPFDEDGKPMTYVGRMKPQGDMNRWRFRNDTTGTVTIVRQIYNNTALLGYFEDPADTEWEHDEE